MSHRGTEGGLTMEEEKLLNSIEKCYGFKRELIKNPQLCGCWFVRFEVNGIEYSGGISFHGALPQLNVIGNTTPYHNEHGTPVENWYYDEYIKDKKAKLLHCVDPDAGDWEDTGIQFQNQKEADEYMHNLDKKDSPNYLYEMIQEEN